MVDMMKLMAGLVAAATDTHKSIVHQTRGVEQKQRLCAVTAHTSTEEKESEGQVVAEAVWTVALEGQICQRAVTACVVVMRGEEAWLLGWTITGAKQLTPT
jgi:hypothetical protein